MERLFGVEFGYDVYYGMGMALGPILGAETHLRGDENSVIAAYAAATGEQALSNFFTDALLRDSLGNPKPIEIEIIMEDFAKSSSIDNLTII